MIKVNMKVFKKRLDLIKNLDKEMQFEQSKFFIEGNDLVFFTEINQHFFKIKTPIEFQQKEIVFGMNHEQFLSFYNDLNGQKNRMLELSIVDNKLNVDYILTTKNKKPEVEETKQYEYTKIKKPKKKENSEIVTDAIEFDKLNEFLILLKTLSTEFKSFTFINKVCLHLKGNIAKLIAMDTYSSFCFQFPLRTECEEKVMVFDIKEFLDFKKMIKKIVDMEVVLHICETSLLLQCESLEFLLNASNEKYPNTDGLFDCKNQIAIKEIKGGIEAVKELSKNNKSNNQESKKGKSILLLHNDGSISIDAYGSLIESEKYHFGFIWYKIAKIAMAFDEGHVDYIKIGKNYFLSIADTQVQVLICPITLTRNKI